MGQVKLQYQLDLEPESLWITATASPLIKSSLPYVQEIGDFITHERYFTKRSGLASYLLKYVVSGEGVLEYKGEINRILPGQVFWIDCEHEQHYYTSAYTKAWRLLWVHFYGNTCREYYEMFLAKNSNSNILNLPPNSDIPALIRTLLKIYGEQNNILETDIRASGILSHIMSECCIATLGNVQDYSQPDIVLEARTYILNNYNYRMTLDDLAERFNINKYYFQKLFKRYIGYTPNEYLILTRLNRAKEYLRTTSLSISEVADKVGVENTSHFINQFKKSEGITPNQYRQSWYR